jgi:hypothetical protein
VAISVCLGAVGSGRELSEIPLGNSGEFLGLAVPLDPSWLLSVMLTSRPTIVMSTVSENLFSCWWGIGG